VFLVGCVANFSLYMVSSTRNSVVFDIVNCISIYQLKNTTWVSAHLTKLSHIQIMETPFFVAGKLYNYVTELLLSSHSLASD
jgi:hypothetical protein